MIRLLAWLILFALPATAQDLPALYTVTDVAPDDTLNIRSGPDAGSPVLGTLAPDATNIEVVRLSPDGRWGVVNFYDVAGWASMSFLTTQQSAAPMMQSLECFGTEPFWSVTFAGHMAYTPMDGPKRKIDITDRTRAINRTDRYALSGATATDSATAVITRRMCSDGMSDTAFGLSLDFILNTRTGRMFLSGCCRLAAE
jgi:uncharacterized membrane protein